MFLRRKFSADGSVRRFATLSGQSKIDWRDNSRLKIIDPARHQHFLPPNHLRDHGRSLSQEQSLIANIVSYGLVQIATCSFHRGSNVLKQSADLPRDLLSVHCGRHCTAAGMPEHVDDLRPKDLRPELEAADVLARRDISGDSSHKEVAEPLIEHDLNRNSRIGATEKSRERRLPPRNRFHVIEISTHRQWLSGRKPAISRVETCERNFRSFGDIFLKDLSGPGDLSGKLFHVRKSVVTARQGRRAVQSAGF